MNKQLSFEAHANAASYSYWTQWSREEIMSMQGVESRSPQETYYDRIAVGEMEHHCSGCMDCLGLSWADFL